MAKINSCQKGKRGERLWRDELRAQGYMKARRGQQFCGGADSPDVICEELGYLHFEVKFVESLNVRKAVEQAQVECGSKLPVVAHKTSGAEWLATMPASVFFYLLRYTTPPEEVA